MGVAYDRTFRIDWRLIMKKSELLTLALYHLWGGYKTNYKKHNMFVTQ
jgi:hypothetical protein